MSFWNYYKSGNAANLDKYDTLSYRMYGFKSNSKIWTLDKKILEIIPKGYVYDE